MRKGTGRLGIILVAGVWIVQMFMVSCISSRKIVVDLYHPPELRLPEEKDTVALVHRISADDRNFISAGKKIIAGKADEGIRVLAGERAMVALIDKIFADSYFTVSGNIEWLDTLVLHDSMMPPPLSRTVVERFCTEKDADLLLSLEAVEYNAEVNYSSYERRVSENLNKVWSKTILYNVQYEIMEKADFLFSVATTWRIYDGDSKEIIFEKQFRDSIEYEVDGKTRQEVDQKLPSYQSAAERAGYVAGEHLSRVIMPSYQTVLRYYFGGGNKEMKKATEYVKFRNWSQAYDTWAKMVKDAKPAVQAKLWYNMALVAEMDGKPEEALSFLTRAYSKHPDPAIIHYRNTILNTWSDVK